MWRKTGPFAELLYLTLIVSVLRPDPSRVTEYLYSDSFGGSSIDDLGPTSAVQLYLNNLENSFRSNINVYPGSKASILLQETIDVFRELNSLGRYSQSHSGRFNNNLFAYLVNGGEETRQTLTTTVAASTSSIESSIEPVIQQRIVNIANSSSPASPSSSSLSSNSQELPEEDLSLDLPSLSTEFGSLDIDDSFVDEVLKERSLEDVDDDGFVENNFDDLNDQLDRSASGLLADEDPMLPVLQNEDDADSLFDELERLLVPEGELQNPLATSDEHFADVWQNNGQIFANPVDPAMISFNSHEQSSNLYFENGNQINAVHSDHPSATNNIEVDGIYTGASGSGTNIGSALAASMATLTNGSEPLPDVGASATIYGSELNDLMYLGNATAIIQENPSGECLLTDLLTDEDLQLMEMTSNNNTNNNQNGNAFANYYHYHHQHQCNSHRNYHYQNGTEDRMDASSDSAVSSMSSDRVHSASEGDWVDSCSETSSHHGDGICHEFSQNRQAQKKYKLFGRRVEKDENFNYFNGSEMQANNTVFSNYSSVDNSFAYSEMNSQVNYYNPSITNNHTYVQANNNNVNNNLLTGSETFHQATPKTHSLRSSRRSSIDSEYNNEQLNRDEKRAKAMRIPISTEDIINLPIDEFNERLAKYELTEAQLSLIRDIRRRGKNKVAAQNCRKRKLDQIICLQTDVDSMFAQKNALQSQHDHLLLLRQIARDKYAKLYQFILEASSSSSSNHFSLSECSSEYPHHILEHLDETPDNSFTNTTVSGSSNSAHFLSKIEKQE